MPRPVKLKLLSETLPEDLRETDQRLVAELVGPLPVPSDEDGKNLLELLGKLHGKTDEAIQAAGTAIAHSMEARNSANQALATVTQHEAAVATLNTKLDAIDSGLATQLAELREIAESAKRQTAGLHIAALVVLLKRFAIDRLPAMLAIVMNFVLYLKLNEPSPMQLASVALFGMLVTAPAVWLSARRKES